MLAEKRGEMSVSVEEGRDEVFCVARRRERIVWVAWEEIIVVAWVLRWDLRVLTILLEGV